MSSLALQWEPFFSLIYIVCALEIPTSLLLPTHASEQGNVIGLVSVSEIATLSM